MRPGIPERWRRATIVLEAIRFKDPVHDMRYLCLARREGATLLTLDKKLAKLCQHAGVNCIGEAELN